MGNNTYSSEMEESVISCVLKNENSFSVLKDICDHTDFWFQPYSWIWKAFEKLYEKNSNIDIITLQDELQRSNYLDNFSIFSGKITGLDGIKHLQEKEDVIIENCETYGLQVKDDSAKRKIQELFNKGTEWINRGNSSINVLTNLEMELGKISTFAGINAKSIVTIEDAVSIAEAEIEFANKNNKRYIESGIKSLDEKIGGFFPQQLTIVAGRTGNGKSSLVQTIAMNASIFNKFTKKVGIFTLEMSNTEYVERMIATISGIPALRLKMGKIYENEWDTYNLAISRIKNSNKIVLDDTPGTSMPIIRNKLRKMKEWGANLAIIDQLSLISDRFPGESEFSRLDRLAYQMKNFAREFNIPIIAVHQMNRSIESSQRGPDKEPRASDLDQAGEKAANLILMITHKTLQKIIIETKLWIVKNRDGTTGCVDVKFEGARNNFRDLTQEEKDALMPDMMKD